jgi:hypothetical protein
VSKRVASRTHDRATSPEVHGQSSISVLEDDESSAVFSAERAHDTGRLTKDAGCLATVKIKRVNEKSSKYRLERPRQGLNRFRC